MNNKIFYQHPNLMRILGMHETVMEVMVNVLGEGESKVRKNLKLIVIIYRKMHFINKAFLKEHTTNTSKGVTQEQCPIRLLITFF